MRSRDLFFMRRALALASRGRGAVSPNPMVGAVLVKAGKIIAEGWHRLFGGAHGEIEALAQAARRGVSTRGATLYVTLEPCIHTDKKTPPCLPELLAAGISRVVVAMHDPNPSVRGRGLRALRKAGIETEVGVLADEAASLNRGFAKWITQKTPYVVMKVGASLDGKIATKSGESKWITSERSRTLVRRLRDECEAILVGKKTVCADDPALAGAKTKPHRIILDSHLETPLTAKVFRDRNVTVVTTEKAPRAAREEFVRHGVTLKVFPKKISIAPLLSYLGKRGITSLFVEGGAEVFGSFIDARVIDELYWFVAPKIIGGREARSAIGGEGVTRVAAALTFKNITVESIGPDFLLHARV